MVQFSYFDIGGIIVFLLITYFISRSTWFYSFYSFAKFILVAIISFVIGALAAKYITLPLPITQLQLYLIIQISLFLALWKLLNFRGLFFKSTSKIFNLNRFIFVHHIDRYLNLLPATVTSFFIMFLLLTILISASTFLPVLQKEIESSKIVKPILYDFYFAGLEDAELFEGIAYNIVPELQEGLDKNLDSINQNVLESYQKKINEERTNEGLNPVAIAPPDQQDSGGIKTFTPEKIYTPTAQPTIYIRANQPVHQTQPTPLPTPRIIVSTIVPTQAPQNSNQNNNYQATTQPSPTPIKQKSYNPPSVDANQTEQDILRLTNEARAKNGVAPLVADSAIAAVARAHSKDMVDRNFFDHINPDGLNPFQRMKAGGITFLAAAENIGAAPTADFIVSKWMESKAHKRNILNPAYTRIGIGVVKDSYYGLMATQDFAD